MNKKWFQICAEYVNINGMFHWIYIITQVYKLIAYLPINKKLRPSLKNFPWKQVNATFQVILAYLNLKKENHDLHHYRKQRF